MLILSWNVRFESPDKLIKKIQSEHLDSACDKTPDFR